MAQLFSNNATGALASGITAVATSLTLGSGEGALFSAPTGGDFELITVYDGANISESTNIEIMQVTARTTDTLTVVRAQEGTAGFAFLASAGVQACNTAATLGRHETSRAEIDTATTGALVASTTWVIDSSAARSRTLAAAPNDGDEVGFADEDGLCATNNATIARNGTGYTITGAAADFTVDVNFARGVLKYNTADTDWKLIQ